MRGHVNHRRGIPGSHGSLVPPEFLDLVVGEAVDILLGKRMDAAERCFLLGGLELGLKGEGRLGRRSTRICGGSLGGSEFTELVFGALTFMTGGGGSCTAVTLVASGLFLTGSGPGFTELAAVG